MLAAVDDSASRRRHRRVQRLELIVPIRGTLGELPVRLLNLSLYGARIEHASPIPVGSRRRLTLHGSSSLSIDVEITRCSLEHLVPGSKDESIYHSGLSFFDPAGTAFESLKQLLVDLLMRAMRQWKANARGVRPTTVSELPIFRSRGMLLARTDEPPLEWDEARRAAEKIRRYACYRLSRDGWERTIVPVPAQPLDGFAVPLDEDLREIEMLCEAYEKSDEDGRRMIRLLAEMTNRELER